jgi:hypothetical protein
MLIFNPAHDYLEKFIKNYFKSFISKFKKEETLSELNSLVIPVG